MREPRSHGRSLRLPAVARHDGEHGNRGGQLEGWEGASGRYAPLSLPDGGVRATWRWLAARLPDHEQFRSVIFLRQGETAHFLSGNAGDRASRFAKLIDLSRYWRARQTATEQHGEAARARHEAATKATQRDETSTELEVTRTRQQHVSGLALPEARRAAEDAKRLEQILDHEESIAAARREEARQAALAAARSAHERELERVREQQAREHAEIERLRGAFDAGQPDAIVHYFSLVLEASDYPEGVQGAAKLAFVPESKQLVIEYELPPFEVVPEAGAYKYVKVRDQIVETARSTAPRRALYTSVLAQVTLRTLHEVFEADRSRRLETVVFNGHVETIDPGTGRHIRPCLISAPPGRRRARPGGPGGRPPTRCSAVPASESCEYDADEE